MMSFEYTNKAGFHTSTFAEEAYYDQNTGTLVIVAVGHATLTYNHVPLRVFEGFCDSDSQGKYFQNHIRGAYTFVPSEGYDYFTKVPVYESEEPEEATAPVAATDPDFSYSVNAYFKDFESARILFSYAEALGTQVTLTAFSGVSDE